ncbi:hypothetical protein D3C86_1927410 [compost metagenome]
MATQVPSNNLKTLGQGGGGLTPHVRGAVQRVAEDKGRELGRTGDFVHKPVDALMRVRGSHRLRFGRGNGKFMGHAGIFLGGQK